MNLHLVANSFTPCCVPSHRYITDDGTDWGANTNTVTFDAYTPVDTGQFFVVINRDAQPTQGTFVVASNDMEAFVYDGSSWYKFNN